MKQIEPFSMINLSFLPISWPITCIIIIKIIMMLVHVFFFFLQYKDNVWVRLLAIRVKQCILY